MWSWLLGVVVLVGRREVGAIEEGQRREMGVRDSILAMVLLDKEHRPCIGCFYQVWYFPRTASSIVTCWHQVYLAWE